MYDLKITFSKLNRLEIYCNETRNQHCNLLKKHFHVILIPLRLAFKLFLFQLCLCSTESSRSDLIWSRGLTHLEHKHHTFVVLCRTLGNSLMWGHHQLLVKCHKLVHAILKCCSSDYLLLCQCLQ